MTTFSNIYDAGDTIAEDMAGRGVPQVADVSALDATAFAVDTLLRSQADGRTYRNLSLSGTKTFVPVNNSGNRIKLDATTDPTTSNDSSEGYGVGSIWTNTDSGFSFECVDATVDAALWRSPLGLRFSPAVRRKRKIPGYQHVVSCDSDESWTGTFSHVSDALTGQEALRLTSSGSNADASLDFGGAVDLQDKHLIVRVKVDNPANVLFLKVFLHDDNALGVGKYAEGTLAIPAEAITDKWYTATINPATASAAHGWVYGNAFAYADFATVQRITIRTRAQASTTVVTDYDSIIAQDGGATGGICTLTFDDGNADMMTIVREEFAARNLRFTAWAAPEWIDDGRAGTITLANLKRLANEGHDIQAHGATALTDLDNPEAELASIAHWFNRHGFGADHFAYPGGAFNPSIQEITGKYFVSARNYSGGAHINAGLPIESMDVLCQVWENGDASTDVTDTCTRATATNGWVIWGFHDVTEDAGTPTSLGMTRTTLGEILDAVVANGIEVLTYAEAWDRLYRPT